MIQLGPIRLPQAPRPATSYDEYRRNVESWARELEQVMRQVERVLNAMNAGALHYIPTTLTAPTTAPSPQDDSVAMVFEPATNKLWIFNGTWKSVTVT